MPDAPRFVAVSLDCADPAELAEFYRLLLGGEVLWSSEDSVGVRVPGVVLAMQRVEGYRPPTWPERVVPAQMHLDLSAGDELDTPETRALELGATRAEPQPDPHRWRVLIDPAGHPICITTITPPAALAPV